jgi:protein phosphatase
MIATQASIDGIGCASITDRGRVRERNEDKVLIQAWPDAEALFVVLADGMGGKEGGRVASAIIVDEFRKLLDHPLSSSRVELFGALHRCFYEAERSLKYHASLTFSLRSMGATVIAAVIEPDSLLFLYAGDCRLYHFHANEPPFITKDHSLVATLVEARRLKPEDARSHPDRSIVTSAICAAPGSQLQVDPPWNEVLGGGPAFRPLCPGDRLLFSTDGLHGEVVPGTIESLAADRNRDVESVAESCIQAALSAGGNDNVTVIVADIGDKQR